MSSCRFFLNIQRGYIIMDNELGFQPSYRSSILRIRSNLSFYKYSNKGKKMNVMVVQFSNGDTLVSDASDEVTRDKHPVV